MTNLEAAAQDPSRHPHAMDQLADVGRAGAGYRHQANLLMDLDTYPSLRAAFQQGYTRQSTWPERRLGEKDSFIPARGLGLANFILTDPDPSWKLQAAEFVKGIEIRLRRLLER